MPPPRKRPRLRFIGSSSPEPDLELATARKRNDNLLKTRWELVFQRYEKDFTGIGDEIGLISGEIEVDHGHLRSMQDEKDIGYTPESPTKFDGRRMLRAMTVAPTEYSDSMPDADEVLQSIETIADNALLSDYSSEDELFDTPSRAGDDEEEHAHQSHHSEQSGDQDESIGSPDDLFDNHPVMRSPSVDSLFASQPQHEVRMAAKQDSPLPNLDSARASSIPLSQNQGITEVAIREQVRRVLQEEREQEKQLDEEKIELAWRLPVRLPSLPYCRPASPSLPRIPSTDRSPAKVEGESEIDLEMNTPIWQPLTRLRRSRREVAAERNLKRIRAESEDPLQEGFSSEPEVSSRQSSNRIPSPPSSRQLTVEHSAQPPSTRSPSGHSSRPWSKQPPVQHSVQPPSVEPPTAHGYATRHALRQRSSQLQSSRPRSSPEHEVARAQVQQSPAFTNAMPDTTASTDVTLYGSIAPSPDVRGLRLYAAADAHLAKDQVRLDLEDRKHMHVLRPSSADNLIPAATEENHVEHQEDTVVVNDLSGPDGTSDIRTSGRRLRQPHRAYHPWEIRISRSGKPMTNLSKSLRRSAAQKYKEGPSKPSSESNPTRPDGSAIAEFTEMTNMDPILAEIERQKILKPMRQGLCVYCHANYQDAHATGSHWDRVLTNFLAGALDDDDPHDMGFLHSIRSKVERRTRAPRTLVRDFRIIVELHEGSGLTFRQIAASKLLLTTKHPSKLKKEYQSYRHVPVVGADNPWTAMLEDKLWEAVGKADDGTTMTSLRRQLVGNNIEEVPMVHLGNKLADRFLEEYRSRNDAFGDQLQMYGGPDPSPSGIVGLQVGDEQVLRMADVSGEQRRSWQPPLCNSA